MESFRLSRLKVSVAGVAEYACHGSEFATRHDETSQLLSSLTKSESTRAELSFNKRLRAASIEYNQQIQLAQNLPRCTDLTSAWNAASAWRHGVGAHGSGGAFAAPARTGWETQVWPDRFYYLP